MEKGQKVNVPITILDYQRLPFQIQEVNRDAPYGDGKPSGWSPERKRWCFVFPNQHKNKTDL